MKSHVEVTNQSEHHHVQALNGTFGAACTAPAGSWSLPVGDSRPLLAHPALGLVPEGPDCALTLTDMVIATGPDEAMLRNPKFDPPIPLSDSWAQAASRLAMEGDPLFVNAKLETRTFADDFAISLVVSRNPGVQVSTVPAPDYASSTEALEIRVDAGNVVDFVSGSVALVDGLHPGDHYAIDFRWLSPSVETWSASMLREAYDLAEEHLLDGPHPRIPAEAFGLIGENIAAGIARTIIISRTEHRVRSFQAIRLTFRAPER